MNFCARFNFGARGDSCVSGVWGGGTGQQLLSQALGDTGTGPVRMGSHSEGRGGASQLLIRISPGKQELGDPEHFV